ncbi:hypothetical protein IV203_004077 [Nitzschia inconspicua]|uniref:Uncharacterized protein n=1 Tax=Nitzschia inconspicua TaxID=303405 RepID=A0A9K3L4P9_9STRA|nr:hypothetical protein IV203_004077 [Nitzschia inconspicua]
MTSIRKLSDSDVRAIFESIHGTNQPPPHLSFKFIRCPSHCQKLSPPSFEFDDGLYILLRPEKVKGPRSCVPPHLQHLEEEGIREEIVQWSLSGPQFPQPTAIQQRYCYPKGDNEYCLRKGGSLWTMYGSDGKENYDFRLLHVYFSSKRAQNKGVSSDEIEEEQKRQRDDVSVSESDGSLSTAAKRQKMSRVAMERSKPSPWQRQCGPYPYSPGMAAPPSKYRPPPHVRPHSRPPSHGLRYNQGYNHHHYHPHRLPPGRPPQGLPMVAPPSPCRSHRRTAGPTEGPPMYVSPNSTSGAYSASGYPYENHSSYPLASFDAEDVEATVNAMSADGDLVRNAGQGSVGNAPSDVFRSRQSFETTHSRHDSHAQIQHLLDEENFETSLLDLETAWKTDPELQINLTFSKDAREAAGARVPFPHAEPNPTQVLIDRLQDTHKRVRRGILDHPPEERAALVSIYASWAREVARSPLEKLPQGQATPASYIRDAAKALAISTKSEGDTSSFCEDRKPTATV